MIQADIVTCCILSSLSSPVFGQMPTWIPDITCLWCSTQRRGCVIGPVAPGTSRQTILLCSHFFDEAHSTNMLPRKKKKHRKKNIPKPTLTQKEYHCHMCFFPCLHQETAQIDKIQHIQVSQPFQD